jgi:hypothetical protein
LHTRRNLQGDSAAGELMAAKTTYGLVTSWR